MCSGRSSRRGLIRARPCALPPSFVPVVLAFVLGPLLAACTPVGLLVTATGVATDTSVTWEVVKHIHGQLTADDATPCIQLNGVQRALNARCEYVAGQHPPCRHRPLGPAGMPARRRHPRPAALARPARAARQGRAGRGLPRLAAAGAGGGRGLPRLRRRIAGGPGRDPQPRRGATRAPSGTTSFACSPARAPGRSGSTGCS